ncbi:MAG TPA: Ig-like domain-containing protein [Planctomycetota bacterium]|nr:Ig-like domain-containing protein [Planctomycetota bacterium]
MAPRARSGLIAAALLLSSCSNRHAAPPPLTLVRTSLGSESRQVLLNQELTVYFSAPVDPLSVTADTVAVLDADGRQLAGRLRVGNQSVTFEPQPPLKPELDDGSYLPDRSYRLVVTGYPRPDGVRSSDGRILQAGVVVPFHTVGRDVRALGLPSPLQPVVGGSLPFLLRPAESYLPVPLDRPRLLLHFTAPVLPTSLTNEAFTVSLSQDGRYQHVEPRALRIVDPRPAGDLFAGCTVELDLGQDIQVQDGGRCRLRAGDQIVVELAAERPLRDYAARAAFGTPQWWLAVDGGLPPLWEWPEARSKTIGDLLRPGFEVLHGMVRPRVRLEAGNGSLGVFRPRQDTVLRPGAPFDRGDGVQVQSRGNQFPFLAIDIPEGITVRVVADQPVQLQSCSGVHIKGSLIVPPGSVDLPLRSGALIELRTLAETVGTTVLAAGDAIVSGSVSVMQDLQQGTALALVTGGNIDLHGSLPFRSVLAVDDGHGSITGTRQDAVTVVVVLTPGLPAGATLEVEGETPWHAMPPGYEAATVELVDADAQLTFGYQFVAPDPSNNDQPDPVKARRQQTTPLGAAAVATFPSGSFVRFLWKGTVQGDRKLPSLRGLRLRSG